MAAFNAVHVEKDSIDHVARNTTGHQACQVAALNAHGCVKVDQRPFHHGSQSSLWCRIQTARFLFQ